MKRIFRRWGILLAAVVITGCGGEGVDIDASDSTQAVSPAVSAAAAANSNAPIENLAPARDQAADVMAPSMADAPPISAPRTVPDPLPPRPGFDTNGNVIGVSAVPFNPCAQQSDCPALLLKRHVINAMRRP